MTTSEERWAWWVGREGKVEISSVGRVRTVPHVLIRSNGAPYSVKGQLRTPYVDDKGYLRVTFQGRSHQIHCEMLKAFVGPRPPRMDGCHNNGDKLDNRLENLRWDTRANNIKDQVKHGTHYRANHRQERCKRGHDLEDSYVDKRGSRQCRECQRIRQRK